MCASGTPGTPPGSPASPLPIMWRGSAHPKKGEQIECARSFGRRTRPDRVSHPGASRDDGAVLGCPSDWRARRHETRTASDVRSKAFSNCRPSRLVHLPSCSQGSRQIFQRADRALQRRQRHVASKPLGRPGASRHAWIHCDALQANRTATSNTVSRPAAMPARHNSGCFTYAVANIR